MFKQNHKLIKIIAVKQILTGFSLIELLVTLAIISAMVLVAVPVFTRYEENASFNAKVTEIESAINQVGVQALNPEQSVVTSSNPYYFIEIDTAGKVFKFYKGMTLNKTIAFGNFINVSTTNKYLKINAGKNYACLMTADPTTNPCGEGGTYVNSGTYVTITGTNGVVKSIDISSKPIRVIVQ